MQGLDYVRHKLGFPSPLSVSIRKDLGQATNRLDYNEYKIHQACLHKQICIYLWLGLFDEFDLVHFVPHLQTNLTQQ